MKGLVTLKSHLKICQPCFPGPVTRVCGFHNVQNPGIGRELDDLYSGLLALIYGLLLLCRSGVQICLLLFHC